MLNIATGFSILIFALTFGLAYLAKIYFLVNILSANLGVIFGIVVIVMFFGMTFTEVHEYFMPSRSIHILFGISNIYLLVSTFFIYRAIAGDPDDLGSALLVILLIPFIFSGLFMLILGTGILLMQAYQHSRAKS
jgi:hypothetical protein